MLSDHHKTTSPPPDEMMPGPLAWRDYQVYVLRTLKRLDKKTDTLCSRVTDLKTDVAVLKTKMIVGAAICAGIVSVILRLVFP